MELHSSAISFQRLQRHTHGLWPKEELVRSGGWKSLVPYPEIA